MKVAIIPARGGSKRIPRKNIKLFHGKPIIAYSIEAAIDAGCFDHILVSTDDLEIAEVAKRYGAEVPYIRPKNISDDHATTLDVIQHAIQWCESQDWQVAHVCCIYATAPFLEPDDLKNGLAVLDDIAVEYAFSATTFPFPIQRAFTLSAKKEVSMLHPEHMQTRSQDLQETYHDAGQFYWGKTLAFKEGKAIFATHSRAICLPRKRVQDIDTMEDWEFAESLYEILKQ